MKKEIKQMPQKGRFEEAYNKANFNSIELFGFRHNPKLAVLAGMVIGYKLALTDLQKKERK